MVLSAWKVLFGFHHFPVLSSSLLWGPSICEQENCFQKVLCEIKLSCTDGRSVSCTLGGQHAVEQGILYQILLSAEQNFLASSLPLQPTDLDKIMLLGGAEEQHE